MNLVENSKLNVAINFQFWFFGIRIDQSIASQLTKVPRGEDPSAEVPKRGGGRRDLSGKEGGRAFYLSMLASFTGLIWPRRVCPAEQVVDIWLNGS